MSLPASFDSNTLGRMVDFLNESNGIESIKEINYYDLRYQKIANGHFGALVDSQQAALNHDPLTLKKIRHWQSLLTREQIPFGHHIDENEVGHIRSYSLPKNVRIASHIPPDYSQVPTLLDYLIERINEGLANQEKLKDDAAYCEFLGRSFLEFEKIHPFADGNGRVGRLIVNYIATYCHRPIIIFNSEMRERNAYYDAHDSAEGMVSFIAKKIQDVIFGLNHTILFKKPGTTGATHCYQSKDGKYQEQYQWHALLPLLQQPKKNSVSSSNHSSSNNNNESPQSKKQKINL